MQNVWIGIVLFAAMSSSPVSAQGVKFQGKNDFDKFCTGCHGVSGKGDGPDAKRLQHRPADLTKLAEKNGGVFPIVEIYNAIDGTVEVWTHGSRDMPIWGELYSRELKSRVPRDYPQDMQDRLVRTRILTMIEYISTLQAK